MPCLICHKEGTSSPICTECLKAETTPAGQPPQEAEQIRSTMNGLEGAQYFLDAYHNAWLKLREERVGVPMGGMELFVANVIVGIMYTAHGLGQDSIHSYNRIIHTAWEIFTRNNEGGPPID